jgi:hypothetical protein
MTLEMPAIDFKGQSAPICVSLTHWPSIAQCTRYFEKLKINISARHIQTKLSTQKHLNTRSILLI